MKDILYNGTNLFLWYIFMKKILLIILIFFWLTQITLVQAWGWYYHSYSSEAEIIKSSGNHLTKRVHSNEFLRIKDYWKTMDIGNNEIIYQLWIWWIVKLYSLNTLQLKFKEKFDWKLIISTEDKYSNTEVIEELKIYNSYKEIIKFNNVWNDKRMFFDIFDNDGNKVRITSSKAYTEKNIIYNNKGISQFAADSIKIKDISWLTKNGIRNLVLESDLPNEYFKNLVELAINNQISILENTNKELLMYIFWENYKDYKVEKKWIEHVGPRYNWIYKLQTWEYWDYYIERKYKVYTKGLIEIFVIDSDYIKENTEKWELMVRVGDYIGYSNDHFYEEDSNPNSEINYNNLIFRSNFFIDSIKEKYKTTGKVISLLIFYVILIIAFYFLVAYRIKNRYAIIYYTSWLGLILFSIYYWLFTLQVWTKDITQAVQINFHYNNFIISKVDYSHLGVNTGNHNVNIKANNTNQFIEKDMHSYNSSSFSNRHNREKHNPISQISNDIENININYNIKPLKHMRINSTLIDFTKNSNKKWSNVLSLPLDSYINTPVKEIITVLKSKKAENVFFTQGGSEFTKNFKVNNSEKSVYIFDIY